MQSNIHSDKIKEIYQLLEDEQSKEIYLNRLNYLLSDDFKYMRDVISKYTPELIPWNGYTRDELLQMVPQCNEFVLYGAGKDGEIILSAVKNDPRFIGFCSKTKEKQENGYLGYPVISPDELLRRKNLGVILATSRAKHEIMAVLEKGEYPKSLIIDGTKYAVDILGDPATYFSPDFMKYEKREIFVDAGCYDMYTSSKLNEYCDSLKVYAFEPDPVNYQLCKKRKKALLQKGNMEIKLFPYGTWNEKATLSFCSDLTEGSHINEDKGNIQVQVMPIDEVVDHNDVVTMIKMDVEGAELRSLEGAKQIIRKCKPKLAICIYHKPEDMWEIPAYVKELVPEYKLHIRHHSSSKYETILYAVL